MGSQELPEKDNGWVLKRTQEEALVTAIRGVADARQLVEQALQTAMRRANFPSLCILVRTCIELTVSVLSFYAL